MGAIEERRRRRRRGRSRRQRGAAGQLPIRTRITSIHAQLLFPTSFSRSQSSSLLTPRKKGSRAPIFPPVQIQFQFHSKQTKQKRKEKKKNSPTKSNQIEMFDPSDPKKEMMNALPQCGRHGSIGTSQPPPPTHPPGIFFYFHHRLIRHEPGSGKPVATGSLDLCGPHHVPGDHHHPSDWGWRVGGGGRGEGKWK